MDPRARCPESAPLAMNQMLVTQMSRSHLVDTPLFSDTEVLQPCPHLQICL